MSTSTTSSNNINSSDYKYWAFISYSHQDEVWAKWLHQNLETYRVPRALVGRETPQGKVPGRLFPVFRDRDELPGAAELNEQIEAALRRSRNLIVICSPRSAVSKWVNEEIKTFKSLGRDKNVFCLIVDGEPNATDKPQSGLLECFPPAVRYRVGSDRELTTARTEPIAADAREGRDGKTNAKLKLISGVLGVGYDDLKQRERRREFRRKLRLAITSACLLLLVGLMYTGMADAGLPLPQKDRIQVFMDAHFPRGVFRPVRHLSVVYRDAAEQRTALFRKLVKAGDKKRGWVLRVFKPRPDEDLEVWSHSQALTALFATPDEMAGGPGTVTPKDLVSYLDTPFTENEESMARIEVPDKNGKMIKYGWLAHPYWAYTQSEPALWTAASLSLALGRKNSDGLYLIQGARRQKYLANLRYTQEVLDTYRPDPFAGGWASFPQPLNGSREEDTYATVLALAALLETHHAGLAWEGSDQKLNDLIMLTAGWLTGHFDVKPPESPWRSGWSATGATGGDVRTFDGLTLQVYATLLQAEDETHHRFVIPPTILDRIPAHLADCANRDLNFPNDAAEFSSGEPFLSPRCPDRKEKILGMEQVAFLWYPWAVDASARWLRRARDYGIQRPEDLTRVRRSLGHLVVDLGAQAVARNTSADWTYLAVEHLYCLSAVFRPPGGRSSNH